LPTISVHFYEIDVTSAINGSTAINHVSVALEPETVM